MISLGWYLSLFVSFIIFTVWPFLESYGWFVVIGGVCSYVLYSSLVAPKVEEIRTAKELERRKKFGELETFSCYFELWFR